MSDLPDNDEWVVHSEWTPRKNNSEQRSEGKEGATGYGSPHDPAADLFLTDTLPPRDTFEEQATQLMLRFRQARIASPVDIAALCAFSAKIEEWLIRYAAVFKCVIRSIQNRGEAEAAIEEVMRPLIDELEPCESIPEGIESFFRLARSELTGTGAIPKELQPVIKRSPKDRFFPPRESEKLDQSASAHTRSLRVLQDAALAWKAGKAWASSFLDFPAEMAFYVMGRPEAERLPSRLMKGVYQERAAVVGMLEKLLTDPTTEQRDTRNTVEPQEKPRCCVELRGEDEQPLVFGKAKPVLNSAPYAVIKVLVDAFPERLHGEKIDKESEKCDARKVLTKLRERDSDWARAILMAKTTGRGYGLDKLP